MRAEMRLRTGPTHPYLILLIKANQQASPDSGMEQEPPLFDGRSHRITLPKELGWIYRREKKLRKILQSMYYRDISYRLLFLNTLPTDLPKHLHQSVC